MGAALGNSSRRPIAAHDLARNLAPFSKKTADCRLRIWRTEAIGALVVAKAAVVAPGKALAPYGRPALRIEELLHFAPPIARRVGVAERVQIRASAEDFRKPQELRIV